MTRLLFVAVFLLATVTPAPAIPACWSMAPGPVHPQASPMATPTECGGTQQGFVLQGSGAFTGLYIELSETILAFHQTAPADVSPYAVFFYGYGFGYANVVDPDIYVTSWLLGSDNFPAAAEWQHANGFMPQWGPYPFPTPLEHSPEPATLLLVGTTLALIGWRVRRGR